jgi:hypothetical protein
VKIPDKLILTVVFFAYSGVTIMNAKVKCNSFGDDAAFLGQYVEMTVLSDSTGKAKVIVSPQLQGRVMTSTAAGDKGLSFGWINRDLIASKKTEQHMNAYGGEDRFWLGPEGGQFSIFFKKGVPFDLEHWFTPAAVDTESFDLVSKSASRVQMKKEIRLVNYSETEFKLRVDREISLLEGESGVKQLGVSIPASVKFVAYQSVNRITNMGTTPWTKSGGLLSIWILGMFVPSPSTTIVVPYQDGEEEKLGPVVNDTYFGKVPQDRLVIGKNVMYFRGDGQYRSKIGLSPKRARPVLGSYDAVNKVLTIVQYTKPQGILDYVNSMWEIQKEPFRGDVVNSYNDGPAKPGARPLGPFYELETSSPAADLAPGTSLEHVHRTFHLQGAEEDLDPIAQKVLGVGIIEIKSAFK